MSEVFDIYTLLFLVLAVVIFIRLRGVLGRRTGNERPPYDPYTRPESPEGTVVALPRGRTSQAPQGDAGPTQQDIDERLERFAKKGSPLSKSLTALIKADPKLRSRVQFLDGALRWLTKWSSRLLPRATRMTLKQLLGTDVLDGFMKRD